MSNMLSMFRMFSWEYFVLFALAIGIILGLIFGLRKLQDNANKIANIVMVSSMGLFVLIEYIGRIVSQEIFNFGDHMPLELFQVSIYFAIFIFFIKKNNWTKLAYLIFTPVSAYNLIFVPTMYTIFSAFSFSIVCYFIANAILLAFSILNMIWLDDDLEKKSILDSTITFVIIISISHLFNVFMRFTAWGVHANYFGTMGEEYDTLISWLYSLIPVPFVCIIPLLAMLIGIEFLLVLPFDLIKTNKKKQNEIEELIALGNLKAQAEHRKKNQKTQSQVLLRGDKKAEPAIQKSVRNSTRSDFVSATKEVNVNNTQKKD